MKRRILSIFVLCFILQGCSIQYHNEKKITAKGADAVTPYGKLKNADAYFYSTVDVVLGSIIKKEPIPPPSNLGFLEN